MGEFALGGLDHGLGGDPPAVPVVEIGIERTTIDADADRDAAILGLAGHRLDVVGPADVAGVEPEPLNPGLHGLHGPQVLMVDVGDDRQRRPGDDVGEPLGGLGLVAGAAHDVAAGGGEGVDLLQRALDIGGLGGGHGLHRDGGSPADGHGADPDLAGGTTGIPGLGGEFAHGVEVRATASASRGRRHRDTAST